MSRVRLIHWHEAEAQEGSAVLAVAGYSGTPLPKKLGIKPGSVVALVGAPPEFDRTLDPLRRR